MLSSAQGIFWNQDDIIRLSTRRSESVTRSGQKQLRLGHPLHGLVGELGPYPCPRVSGYLFPLELAQ